MVKNDKIDEGKAFDWSKVASDYAKFRDIYPQQFYQKIIDKDLCVAGQTVLDLGTGTGVLPRNLYQYGAKFTGTDISDKQIEEAVRVSNDQNMDINYECVPTEKIAYEDAVFDVITACQCFFYFDHQAVAEKLYKMLKPGGKLLILYMAWLPFEDRIAGESEKLVLKYNPKWSGREETRKNIAIPDIYRNFFEIESEEVYDIKIPFTRESWNGRMRACRGIGASLSEQEVMSFDQEHKMLLEAIAPDNFEVLHYAAMAVLKVRSLAGGIHEYTDRE